MGAFMDSLLQRAVFQVRQLERELAGEREIKMRLRAENGQLVRRVHELQTRLAELLGTDPPAPLPAVVRDCVVDESVLEKAAGQ